MVRLLKQLLSSQKGQGLPIVLVLLAIGGLTIAVSLNYATTSLKGSRILEEGTKGVYAADAGVEHALWSLGKGIPTANTTPENIDQMAVNIQTENKGTYTMYLDELIQPEPGVHTDWLNVDGEITSTNVTDRYQYTINITRQEAAKGNIRLVEVGAVLPMGYTYVDNSTASFPENLSKDDPTSSGNTSSGACWLKWLWKEGEGPLMTANHTQELYIDGTGSVEGEYAWVVAQSKDVGTVGEITGTLYTITATATRPGDGRTTAEIVADVMIVGGTTYIFSWQITK